MLRFGIALLSLLISACTTKEKTDSFLSNGYSLEDESVYEIAEKPRGNINLEKVAAFGNEEFIMKLGSMTVGDSGKVYIADAAMKTVHVFSAAGNYITNLGREGRGPGEFIGPPRPVAVSDKLFLYDPYQIRINIYSTVSLQKLETRNLNPRNLFSIEGLEYFSINNIYFLSGDRYLLGFMQPLFINPSHPRYNINSLTYKYYMMNRDGKIDSDLLLEQRGLNMLAVFNSLVQQRGVLRFVEWVKGNQIFE